jgi:hypothetical protein
MQILLHSPLFQALLYEFSQQRFELLFELLRSVLREDAFESDCEGGQLSLVQTRVANGLGHSRLHKLFIDKCVVLVEQDVDQQSQPRDF